MIRKLFLLSFLAVLIIVPQAKADHMTYDFWAKTKYSYLTSDFFLKYVDYDDDAKFSLNELVPGTFSGVNSTWFLPPVLYSEIVLVPQYHEPNSLLTDGTNGEFWVFGYDQGPPGFNMFTVGINKYTCIQGPEGTIPWPPPTPPSGVPLPTAILLLGAGLGRLAIYKRRKLSAKK